MVTNTYKIKDNTGHVYENDGKYRQIYIFCLQIF